MSPTERRETSGPSEESYRHSLSQGSVRSYMASWIPNRFSASASANNLDEDTLDNGLESNSDTLQR